MIRAALLLSLLTLAGCTSFAHPLLGESGEAFDQRLVGHWVVEVEEDETLDLAIQPDGEAQISSSEDDGRVEKETFRVRTARLGEFDIANAMMNADGETFWHLLRYELVGAGEELHVFICDGGTWYDAVHSRKLSGRADRGQHGPSTFVTASTQKLRAFLRSHHDSAFVAEPLVLRKTP